MNRPELIEPKTLRFLVRFAINSVRRDVLTDDVGKCQKVTFIMFMQYTIYRDARPVIRSDSFGFAF